MPHKVSINNQGDTKWLVPTGEGTHAGKNVVTGTNEAENQWSPRQSYTYTNHTCVWVKTETGGYYRTDAAQDGYFSETRYYPESESDDWESIALWRSITDSKGEIFLDGEYDPGTNGEENEDGEIIEPSGHWLSGTKLSTVLEKINKNAKDEKAC